MGNCKSTMSYSHCLWIHPHIYAYKSYMLKIIQSCCTSGLLTREKVIICNSVLTLSISIYMLHVDMTRLCIFISLVSHSASQMRNPPQHYISSVQDLTQGPLEEPLIGMSPFWYEQYISRHSISLNLCSARQTGHTMQLPFGIHLCRHGS